MPAKNGRRANINARQIGPAPWPAPVPLPAPTCFGVGRLAAASVFTKWPTRRDSSVPVGLLIIKIALMDINLMLIDIYLHNFTPHRCSYELMKLGIFTFFSKLHI